MIMVSVSQSPEQMKDTYGKNRSEALRKAGIQSGAIHGLIFIRRCAVGEESCGRRVKKVQPFLWPAVFGCGAIAHGDRLSCLDSANAQARARILQQLKEFL